MRFISVLFIAIILPIVSEATEDFVIAACGKDFSRMTQIYATTDVDLNHVAKNGKTALTCLSAARSFDGVSLLTRLKGGNLDVNALDANGDGFISSIFRNSYCDLDCKSFITQSLQLFATTLHLEKHLIDGKVLTISDVSIDLKMLFSGVPSFANIINAKDANGNTLLTSFVSTMGDSAYDFEAFNQLLQFPNIDTSTLNKLQRNLLSFPYVGLYAREKETTLKYFQNLARIKAVIPKQLDTSWLDKNGDNLISLAYRYHGQTTAEFLLANFNFATETLLQKNNKDLATCNFVFGNPILIKKLKDKNALTQECIEFEKEASFAKFEFTSMAEYPEMQKTFYTSSDFVFATNDKGISVMRVPGQYENSMYIYIFDQSVWPLKLIKRFDFANNKKVMGGDILLTLQGNVLLSIFNCYDGRDCKKYHTQTAGIDLTTLNITVAPWRKYEDYNLFSYQGSTYYNYGLDFGYEFYNRIDPFTPGDPTKSFSLKYFEPPVIDNEVFEDPHSTLIKRTELSLGGKQPTVSYCFDSDLCVASDSVNSEINWFVREKGNWRRLEIVGGSFYPQLHDIVFADSTYTVGWFSDPKIFWQSEKRALIFNPKTKSFSLGKKRKEYGNFILGTSLKVVAQPTKFPLQKLELKDIITDQSVSICFVPEGTKLDYPIYLSKSRNELQFYLEEDDTSQKAPQFLRTQCN